MKRIFKYDIPIANHFELELPLDTEILTFQSQKGSFYIWAIIEEGLSIEKRYFRLAGTGHDLTEDSPKIKKYIGTAQIANGELVFHLFELYKRREVTLSKKVSRKRETFFGDNIRDTIKTIKG